MAIEMRVVGLDIAKNQALNRNLDLTLTRELKAKRRDRRRA